MKKLLLFTSVILLSFASKAQVIFQVENPPSLTGNYDFNLGATGWGFPDMSDPINAIVDTLAFCDDGTAEDSLACFPLVNGVDVTGKIAVLYRGSCEFGTKALNAQNAGAVGVIIINNAIGTVTPSGGTDGANVTIPVIAITQADGALLRDSIMNGNVVAFIGSKLGYYGDDIGFYEHNILRAKQFGNHSAISQNATQFDVPVGAWVYNYGANAQSSVTLTATVTHDGNNVYTQASTPVSIPINDSAYVSLPTFSQSSYANGYYTLNYNVAASVADEYTADNNIATHFVINDSLYSYASLDSATYAPITTGGSRISGSSGYFTSCITLKSPDVAAVGLFPTGMTFSALTNDPDLLTGQYFEINLYEWNDVFTDINDATFNSMVQVASGEYVYSADLQGEAVYAPFLLQYPLMDNQWYLACVSATDASVFIGYDNEIDYTLNSTTYKTPMFPIGETVATQSAFGGGTGEAGLTTQAPAIALHLETGIGITETTIPNITPFPNPTSDYISIPMGDIEGDATITIVDLSGKIVKTEALTFISNEVTKFDVSNLPNGMYIFRAEFENGNVSKFNVVVSK